MTIRKILERLRGRIPTTPQLSSRSSSLEQARAEFEAAEGELAEVRRKAREAGRALITPEEIAAAQRVHALQLRLIEVRAASVHGGGAPGAVNLMDVEEVAEVGIDEAERLYVKPASYDFSHIYRAGMEVQWSPEGKFLYSPKPREWSYLKWYGQILCAAKSEYRVSLHVTENTRWVGVGDALRNEIIRHAASDA